jgi:hypothetical protein
MKTILRERQLAEKNGQEKKQPEKPKIKIKKVRKAKLPRTTKSQGKRKRRSTSK